ncbi:MAG: amidohydrolase [Rikenellaceae bacterium]|jgi:5-methylthioadenosine/S-adenosylhomocysteine deaminase|nr:amidohydrolase [Rikenellaceae bacterium]
MNILIENALVLPMCGSGVFTGSVGIADGRIAMATDSDAETAKFKNANAAGLKVIDGRNRLVMPGLINLHNHAAMSLMRSYADDIPLMRWLNDHIWPMERLLTREKVILGAKLAIAEMLLGGTTTFVDMYWMQEAVAEAVEESGVRGVLAPTMIDFKREAFEEDFAAVIGAYGSGRHERISVQAAAHAPFSCSVENLRRVVQLAEKHDVGVNIHLAETLDEEATIRERYGKSPTHFVDELGMLGPRTLANHCVQVSDEEIELLAARGVSVAHNPQSNMKLGNGAAPVVKMLAAGVNVGLGTDGPCSNNDLDMWEELRTASFLQKSATSDPLALPAYEALKAATVHGARAIGMEGSLGVLREGAIADLILLDVRKPHLTPQKDMVANLAYSAKSGDVETVIVAGRVVVENRRLLTLDVEEIIDRVTREPLQ